MLPGGIELVPSDYESSVLTTELSRIKKNHNQRKIIKNPGHSSNFSK